MIKITFAKLFKTNYAFFYKWKFANTAERCFFQIYAFRGVIANVD